MLDDGRRLEVLAAIGIDVYRLRATDVGAPQPVVELPRVEEAALPAGRPRLVIACPGVVRRDARFARVSAQIVRALGVSASAVRWIETTADDSAPLPDVPAYLMIGPTAARACSAHLSLEQQNTATIAVSAEGTEMFRDAVARRATWQALKPLLRRLRAG